MVKLTEQQKKELEALANMPDDEIDFSDIPERPIDWSKARIAPFYRPKWKEFRFKLNTGALEWFEARLSEGQSLDEEVSKALRAQMFRIRFPVRVQKAERVVRRIQASPEEMANLFEAQKQMIEILYTLPVEKVARQSLNLELGESVNDFPPPNPVWKVVTLALDENVIDWFEYRLEDEQSLDEAISKALVDHILWIQSSEEMQRKEIATQGPVESA